MDLPSPVERTSSAVLDVRRESDPPAEATPPGESSAAARLVYQPGLDGLRAVALLAIFVVHADVGLASGGFLAVSTFFTLSGFLITSLIVNEFATTGRVDLRSFWARRARRLLPAALVVVAIISCCTVAYGSAGQISRLFGDAVGALAYVANWRFIRFGDTYGAGFEGESLLLHFWSLAIEEQFYLVFPLLCAGVFASTRRWRVAGALAFGAGVLLSLATGVVGAARATSIDRLYFGTEVRAAELLVGALLAMWWFPRRARLGDGVHRTIRVAGPIALVTMLALIAIAHSRDLAWYRGGLIAYALVTCVVILSAIEPRGAVRAALSSRPLVAIGIVSYGAYLVHWPIFVWLRTGTSVSGAGRWLLGTALSIGLAAVSYRLLERPIRERRLMSVRALVGAGTVVVLATLLVAGVAGPRLSAARNQIALADARSAVEASLRKTLAAPGEAPTVALFGDSTALVTSVGLGIWDDTNGDVRLVEGWANLGCSIMSPATIRQGDVVQETPAVCAAWLDGWRTAVARTPIDVSLVMFGPWEVFAMKPAGVGDFHVIGSPEIDAVVKRNLAAGIEALLANSKVVAIATSPYVERGRLNRRSPERAAPESEHARMDRLNELMREVASRYDRVAVVDLASFVAQGDDAKLRPDGVHFTADSAVAVSGSLGPTLASLAPGADTALAARPGLLPVLQAPKR